MAWDSKKQCRSRLFLGTAAFVLTLLLLAPYAHASGNRSTYISYASNSSAPIVLDLAHQQLFVAWEDLDRVDVLSVTDYHVIHSMVMASPSAIDLSPDSTTLAVATRSSHILFFDTTTYAKTNDVVFRNSGLGISGFLYTANGNAIVRAEEGLSTGGGITAYWNHVANSFQNVSDALGRTGGAYLTDGPMARSGDYSRIILGDATTAGGVQIIDGNTGNEIKGFGYGAFIYSLAINRNATRYAVCLGASLLILDGSFSQIYQDQTGCSGMTFSADGNTLYRDVANGSGMNTQALDMTSFTTHSTTNLYWQPTIGFPTSWRAADNTGMVYGTMLLYPGGRAFVALDTTQSSTPGVPTDDPLHIMRVVDNIGSSQGGDAIRILCTGIDNVSGSSISVTVGGSAATAVSVTSPLSTLGNVRQLTVKTPAGKPGLVNVTVSTSSGSDTASNAFQYADDTKTFPFATSPTFLTYDSYRGRLYASNGGEVEVIDPVAKQVLAPLVPASGKLSSSQFEGLSLSPDGARLYIADAGAKLIHVLNLNNPGTGVSIDPGAMLRTPGSISPSRVYELASGRLIGSDGGQPDGGTYSPGVFLIDLASNTASWAEDFAGNQVAGILWGITKDGRYVLKGASINGLISAQASLWDDASSRFRVSTALIQDGPESALDDDGTIIAVGGSTPGILSVYPEIVGFDLNPVGFIKQQFGAWPPSGTPSLSFNPSGSLLYKAGNNQTGSVVIYDVQQWQSVGTIVFPEMLVTSYDPAIAHMLATDDTGRYFFVSTQSGITMLALNAIPLSVGHVQPGFGQTGGGETVTIRGSGFQPGAYATFGGVQAATTFVDGNTMTAMVPNLPAGWQDLTITNPNGASYTFTGAFQVLGAPVPTPVITGFSPSQIAVQSGIPGFDTTANVTIEGSGFSNVDTVEINGLIVDRAFIDASHMQATIPSTLTGTSGMLTFVVNSPYAGPSNTMLLPMVNPVPVALSVSPDSLVTGATNDRVSVYGTGFVNSSVIQWNGQNLNATLLGGITAGTNLEMLFAPVPADLVANSGTATLTVFNPGPGGGTSNALIVKIEPAHPVVMYPATIDFGPVIVNTVSAAKLLSLVNSGTANYVLTSATVTAGPFSVQSGQCPQLQPGWGCGISLLFSPSTPGPATGTLVLVDNTAGSPHSITLTGTATVPRTLNVPGDAAGIQAGIDIANNGDTLVVAPGTYLENINFKGKNIKVTSSGGPAQTILDAGKTGNVVSFTGGETRAAVLNGFTVQNGRGAGISVSGANPTITDNVITNNLGYGINLNFSGALIHGNTISNTTTNISGTNFGCDWSDGSGIYVGGTSNEAYGLEISNNIIQNNVSQCEGGAIQLYAAPVATISNNILRNNQAMGEGGAISLLNGNQIYILQNLIYSNTAGAAGGAIYLGFTSGTNWNTGPINSWITNNTIVNNTIVPNTLISGYYVDGSQIAFGGYAAQSGLFNNIIIAGDTFAAVACYPTYQYLSGTAPVVAYSDVQNTKGPVYGGWCTTPTGPGKNISDDPKFVNVANGDYHLLTGSPAIDAGYNAALGLQAQDLDGNARIQNGSGATVAVADMGAYEFAGAANLRAPSQVSLHVPTGKPNYGESIQISATATSASDTPITSGNISFLDNWGRVAQAAVDQTGTANFSVSTLGVGTHWLVATFDGSASFYESASVASAITVQGFATSTSLTFSADPVDCSQSETLTATVTSSAGTPTGNVLFAINGSISRKVTVPLDVNGVAKYTTASIGTGTIYIQALYQGQAGFLASNSTNLPLENPCSTLVVTAFPSTEVAGSSVSFTARMQGTGGTPTGNVTFKDGDSVLGSAAFVSGSARYSTSSLTAGTHSVTASYAGDANYGAFSSDPVSVVIQDFSMTPTATDSLTVRAGQSVTRTIVISPISGYVGAVSVSCAVPTNMRGATCTATPVQISSASSQTSTLTITTVARKSAMLYPANKTFRGLAFILGAFFLAGIPHSVRRRRVRMMIVAVMILMVLGMCSCGGGSGSSGIIGSGSKPDSGTPSGTYTLAITATAGMDSHSMTQVVIVE